MILGSIRRGLALVGFLLGALAGPAQAKAPAPRPAMWQVSDADTTIYLFGTIHLLPRNYAWRTSRFDKAVAGSQSLVVETIIDESNPMAVAAQLARLGFRPGLPPIAQRVPPEKRPQLAAAIAKTGLPAMAFDRMESWAAAFMLLGTQFKELGLVGDQGVEAVLKKAFTQAGKPIGQLESNVEQLSLFDSLPEAAQRALLEGAIEAPGDVRVQFQQMLAAWSRGDVASIARSFNEDMASSPELRDALIRRRNANWSNWIARRMAAPGTVFVAVGAGHLAGPESVQRYLESRGYRVRRLQ
jgi:hypothetical protein